MASFNKIVMAGHLTRDPEIRYTPKGTPVAQFGIAANRSWKTESGETKEEVCFVDVDAWGRTGEVIAQYFHKGKPILLEGRLSQEHWTDKTSGHPRSKHKIVLESFSFMDGKKEGAGSPPPRGEKEKRPQADKPGEAKPVIDPDDDVPF